MDTNKTLSIELTEKQLQKIYSKISKADASDIMASDIDKAVNIIEDFIFRYVNKPWLQDKITNAIKATPVQIELFPADNIL